MSVLPERWLHGFCEAYGFRGYCVLVRASLQPGKHGFVYFLGQLFATHYYRASWSAQCFVRCRHYYVRVRHGRWICSAGDKPGEMRHVHEKVRADFVTNLAEMREVYRSWISGIACRYNLRLVLLCQSTDFVKIYEFVFLSYTILHGIIVPAREVHGMPMREMAAVVKAHPHERVSQPKEREEHRLVRRRAGIRLDVHVLRAKKFFRPLYGKRFNLVYVFLPAVISLSRISFGITILGRYGQCFKHRQRCYVIGGNHVQRASLLFQFFNVRRKKRPVLFGKMLKHLTNSGRNY